MCGTVAGGEEVDETVKENISVEKLVDWRPLITYIVTTVRYSWYGTVQRFLVYTHFRESTFSY